MSVRGWISGVEGQPSNVFSIAGSDGGQFRDAYVSVDGVPFASGGIAETGSFIVLDVPPGDATLTFQTPTIAEAKLEMKAVPPSADVLLPGVVLSPTGARMRDPSKAVIRVPGNVTARRPTKLKATIAGAEVTVFEVPVGELTDRRDFPAPHAP